MFNNLSAFLDRRATPEQKAVMMHACRVLLEAGYPDHEAVLEQEVITADQQDSDLYTEWLETYLSPLYRQQLLEFGITVNPDATQDKLTSILESVMRLDNWADPEAIHDLADHDEDTVSTLADMLSVVSSLDPVYYLDAIDAVSPDLIDRIADVTRSQIDNFMEIDPAELVEGRQKTWQRVVNFQAQIPSDRRTLLSQYLENQGRLYESVKIIVFPYYRPLKAMSDLTHAAQEILALLAATTLPTAELARATMGLLEQLGGDDEVQLGLIARNIETIVQKATENESL